jgi:hypothetical protein
MIDKSHPETKDEIIRRLGNQNVMLKMRIGALENKKYVDLQKENKFLKTQIKKCLKLLMTVGSMKDEVGAK